MEFCEIGLDGRSEHFSVRSFRVHASLSSLFTISLFVRSEHDDADLDGIVGCRADVRIDPGRRVDLSSLSTALGSIVEAGASLLQGTGALHWSGICSNAELIDVEPGGLSTYNLTVVPSLWLLSLRRNYRVFQQMKALEIAATILREWDIEFTAEVNNDLYEKLDYRVQHGESDLAFLSRTLEDAGITYYFRQVASGTQLVLTDHPEEGELRSLPLPFVQDTSTARMHRYATAVFRSSAKRPGTVALRDYDFRNPVYPPRSEAKRDGRAARFEQFFYEPGESLRVNDNPGDTPVADHQGAVRVSQAAFDRRAENRLASMRLSRKRFNFRTSAAEISPGDITAIVGHPRSDLGVEKRLLVSSVVLEGMSEGGMVASVEAYLADRPYKPPIVTPRALAVGLQSATVVGPVGNDIHTDEFGRVQIQFPWDRYGNKDEHSSCWVRVSQGSAGAGFGVFALPRVGEEVLVGFLDGDPDEPIVVGRLFNRNQSFPYPLPENKTISAWKTRSSPGSSGGSNEVMFEDQADHELLAVRAARNHEERVGHDQQIHVANDQTLRVGGARDDEVRGALREEIGGDARRTVQGDLREVIVGTTELRCDGARRTMIGHDDSVTIRGGKSLSIGDFDIRVVGAEGGDASAHSRHMINGYHWLAAAKEIDVRSQTGITLRCGTSILEVRPDGVRIRAQKIELEAEEKVVTKAGTGSLTVADDLRIVATTVRADSTVARLQLDTEARLRGPLVKLLRGGGANASRTDGSAPTGHVTFRVFGEDGAREHCTLVIATPTGEVVERETDDRGEVRLEGGDEEEFHVLDVRKGTRSLGFRHHSEQET